VLPTSQIGIVHYCLHWENQTSACVCNSGRSSRLIFLLVPEGGYLVGAAIVSAYFVVSITWTALYGLSILKREEGIA
jgi:hypothetical protein